MGSDCSEGCAQVSGEIPGRILGFTTSPYRLIVSRAWLDVRTRETEGTGSASREAIHQRTNAVLVCGRFVRRSQEWGKIQVGLVPKGLAEEL